QADCGLATCSSSIGTNLTVVPCTQNFETQTPAPVVLQFVITNEFEQSLSAQTTLSCWGSFNLEDINHAFTTGALGGSVVQTRMTSHAADPTKPVFGVMAVVEETHAATITSTSGSQTLVARAAQNVHTGRDAAGQDVITIPGEQVGQEQ